MPSANEDEAHLELQAYTLTHGGPGFIHQHVVDAWTAQRADERTKPIGLAFALVGLYLHLEQGHTGREVQRVHAALARRGGPWPSIALPGDRGAITPSDVMAVPAGPERDRSIGAWCASVWEAYRDSRQLVVDLLARHGLA